MRSPGTKRSTSSSSALAPRERRRRSKPRAQARRPGHRALQRWWCDRHQWWCHLLGRRYSHSEGSRRRGRRRRDVSLSRNGNRRCGLAGNAARVLRDECRDFRVAREARPRVQGIALSQEDVVSARQVLSLFQRERGLPSPSRESEAGTAWAPGDRQGPGRTVLLLAASEIGARTRHSGALPVASDAPGTRSVRRRPGGRVSQDPRQVGARSTRVFPGWQLR